MTLRAQILLCGLWSVGSAAQSIDVATGLHSEKILMVAPVGERGLNRPTDLRFLPDGRMILTEKGSSASGRDEDTARVLVRQSTGELRVAGKFRVDSTNEKGLLGIELDPDYRNNRRLFLYYSAAGSAGGTDLDRHRLVSLKMRPDDTLDRASEQILIRGLRGPANHDGGALAIGPDGKLYVGVGDTGCNALCCPAQNMFASCLSNANGKILRINLDGSIPPDNPLVNRAGVTACGETCTSPIDAHRLAPPRSEIWAWGLRNPWRIWFDPRTGNLWVGDVGELTREEIDIVHAGKHYGWPFREGKMGVDVSTCEAMTPGAGSCVEPVFDCVHDGVCASITGGAIVDSCSWPAPMRGQYYFGDNVSGRLFALKLNQARDGAEGSSKVIGRFAMPVTLRPGPDGNLYVVDHQANAVFRVLPIKPADCPQR
jgi:glucose/arabinose dehydrogenase